MILYQVLPRLFGNETAAHVFNGSLDQNGSGKLLDLDEAAIAHIKSLGCTAVWLCGVVDHATAESFPGKPASHPDVLKGKAGSPYAIRNYFDIAPYLARDPESRLEEFRQTARRLQAAGLKVVVDFVPNHTAREYVPLQDSSDPRARMHPAEKDDPLKEFSHENFYFYLKEPFRAPESRAKAPFVEALARATGNDCFEAAPSIYDWYETVKVNYGLHPRTGKELYQPMPVSWPFMLSVLEFWLDQGVDGFRCDMVDMVPLPFWQWALARLRHRSPDCLFIGESYDPSRYHGLLDAGFDYLYDKVGLYDATLAWLSGEKPSGALGTALWNNRPFDGRLLRFSENHDEVRLSSSKGFGKTLGSEEAVAAGVKAFAIAALAGDGPVMLYMGQELGEPAEEAEGYSGADGKTTIFDFWTVQSLRRLSSGKAWDGKDLLPMEKEILWQYRQIAAIRQWAGPGARLYNLQPANPGGFGKLAFEDGFAFCLYGRERIFFVLAGRGMQEVAWEARLPRDLFHSTGHAIHPGRLAQVFPKSGPAQLTLTAAKEGGILLRGTASLTAPLILEL